MATLTKIERPAEAASAVDVAEPAAPVVKEFKGLSGTEMRWPPGSLHMHMCAECLCGRGLRQVCAETV